MMTYTYKNNEITLLISDEVMSKYLAYMKDYDFNIEKGGIIAGQLNPAEKQIIVTDFSEPNMKDKCSAFLFKRSEFGHQKVMDDLWESSGYTKTYLGEWHTHNQKLPHPSYKDIRNWTHISKREHNSRWLFFIIIGTEGIGVWTVKDKKIFKLVEKIDYFEKNPFERDKTEQ